MRLAFVSSTRADWGLLKPLAEALRASDGVRVDVLATNMHLRPECGMTVEEIRADGFEPVEVPTSGALAETAAGVLTGVSRELQRLRPDRVVLLGDRFEILSAAQAAIGCRVPIVHIAGGTVSEGAIDNACRDAVTMLSDLHLCETDRCRDRIVAMGKDPRTVTVTGAIGLHNLLSEPPMERAELSRQVGLDLSRQTLLVTLHAATLAPNSPEEQYAHLLDALETLPDTQFLFTYPNNDVDPEPLVAMLRAFAGRHPGRAVAIPSLGRVRYLSALRYVSGVVGNSSSGIVEVPSAGIPTLDIGIRQNGREHGPSVLRVADTPEAIADGLRRVLSPETQGLAVLRQNPYHRPDTLQKMLHAILP